MNEDVIDLNVFNQSDEDTYILRIDADPNISVRYTDKKIKGGHAILLRVKLNPKKKGKFHYKVRLYLSSNPDPLILNFKGKLTKLMKNQLTACPDFSNSAFKAKRSSLKKYSRTKKNLFYIELLPTEEPSKEILFSVKANDTSVNRNAHVRASRKSEKLIAQNQTDSLNQANNSWFTKWFGTLTDESATLDESYLPNNIVFLIDASSSMENQNKLTLLKAAMKDLLQVLRPIDFLSIVIYSGEATTLLSPTSGVNKKEIKFTIDQIRASGSTQAVKGIKRAMEIGQSSFISGGNNQIFLATDGEFKLGERNESTRELIHENASKGLNISVLAIKNNRWTNSSLKEIVKLGEGDFIRIQSKGNITQVVKTVKKQSAR